MIQQSKFILESKNFLKENLKGSFLEEFAKKIYKLTQGQRKIDFIVNEEDNNLAIKILHKILTKDSNCIDIGCNTGDFLIPILKLSPFGKHYAFEPIPRLANRLKKKFPKTEVIEVALSDYDGEATFWYVADAPALSSLKKDFWNRHITNAVAESITVKTQKLDNVLPSF